MLTQMQADRVLEKLDGIYDVLIANGYTAQAVSILKLQESIEDQAEREAAEQAGF